VAFLILPVLFGPVGIILAAVGKSKNEPRSTVALAVSIVGTVMGMIIGWIVGSTFGY
jgi:membrane protein YqaA with SNARE-associated domain